MSDKKIIKHPSVQLNDSIKAICEPLKAIGIDYFTQVRISQENGFAAITNNPEYHIHYLNNHYYNCDIHLANNSDLGDMIVWDMIKRSGNSDQMVREATEFGISHLFTLVKKNKAFADYFHFASSQSDETINQRYISQRDWLEKFIRYFSDKVKSEKSLSSVWNIQFGINENNAAFEIAQNADMEHIKGEQELTCNNFSITFGNKHFFISAREYSVLHWLSLGKTAEEIALILDISASTVRKHIEKIKKKSGCYTSFQLGMLFTAINNR